MGQHNHCVEGALAAARAAVGEVHVPALGSINQRETTLTWDHATGRLLHNAIVWHDTRTAASCCSVASDCGAMCAHVPSRCGTVSAWGLPVLLTTRCNQLARLPAAPPYRLEAHNAEYGPPAVQDNFRPVTSLPVSTDFNAYTWR